MRGVRLWQVVFLFFVFFFFKQKTTYGIRLSLVGSEMGIRDSFEATLALIDAVGFAGSFSFKYSARPGTPAAQLSEQVSEPVKQDRLARLQQRLEAQRRSFNTSMVGAVVDVLFEKSGRYPGQIIGKSPYLQAVVVEAPEDLIGKVRPVRLLSNATNSMGGEILPMLEPSGGRA